VLGSRKRAWFWIAVGGAAFPAIAALAFTVGARISLAPYVVLGAIAILAVAAGVSGLRQPGSGAEPVSYRHTYRLFAALGGLITLALVARGLAVPSSFGERGYYRGDARREAMVARAPRLAGKQTCVECHKLQSRTNDKDVHRSVQCEDCHGPGDAHVKDAKSDNIASTKDKAACLVCHRLLSARPGPFPQVAWRDHFKAMGVTDEKTECVECHDPHEPLFLERPLSEARMHPLIHRCRDCHTGRIDEAKPRPPTHPMFFECGYCHAAKAADFADRPHGDIACTKCHLFQKESDFAGRIVLNSDPRFCLLCHGKADFRAAKTEATLIDWPKHLEDVRAESKDDSTPCVPCHRPQLHGEPGATPRVGGPTHG
jgi:hypothetical protein